MYHVKQEYATIASRRVKNQKEKRGKKSNNEELNFLILQKNNHYRISATPTFVWFVIDNYYNNEIQWILRLPKYL